MYPKNTHFRDFSHIFANFYSFYPLFSTNLGIRLEIPLAYSLYMSYFNTYLACIYRKIALQIFYFTNLERPIARYQPKSSPSNHRPHSYRNLPFVPPAEPVL